MNKRINIISINSKGNVRARTDIEIVYYGVAVHHVGHLATKILPKQDLNDDLKEIMGWWSPQFYFETWQELIYDLKIYCDYWIFFLNVVLFFFFY